MPKPTADPRSLVVKDLFAVARYRALTASSVRMRAHLIQGTAPTTFEVAGRLDGTNYSVRVKNSNGIYEVWVVGGVGFMRGDDTYMTKILGADKAAQVKGKWLLLDAAKVDASPFKIRPMLDAIFTGPPDTQLDQVTAKAEVDPSSGATLLSTGKDAGNKLVVSPVPEVLPVSYSSPSSSQLEVGFLDWDNVALLTRPDPSLVVAP